MIAEHGSLRKALRDRLGMVSELSEEEGGRAPKGDSLAGGIPLSFRAIYALLVKGGVCPFALTSDS